MEHRTLIDEYGDTGILQPGEENRRDGSGRQLGPKPTALAQKPYDLRQIECEVEPRVSIPRRTVKAFARVVGRLVPAKIRIYDDEADVSGNQIDGP